jgi:hypothetical protein
MRVEWLELVYKHVRPTILPRLSVTPYVSSEIAQRKVVFIEFAPELRI